jgi:hypothetical protein
METSSELEQKGKDLAISSLAVSIACIFMTLGTLSFIGSILGHIALGKLKIAGNTSHKGFATAGIIVGYVATGISFILIFGFIAFFALTALSGF